MNEHTKPDWLTDWRVWFAIISVLFALAVTAATAFAIDISQAWEWLRSNRSSEVPKGNVWPVIVIVVPWLIAIWRVTVVLRLAKTEQQRFLEQRYYHGNNALHSDAPSARLDGVDTLKNLAKEHRKQYHIRIMRLFCDFVRTPPLWNGEPTSGMELRPDVQAAICAIGERSRGHRRPEEKVGFKPDLHGAHLRYADMKGLNFAGANLRRACLYRAALIGAKLAGTNLIAADLRQANLADADLAQANLADADLTRAAFTNANLAGANLTQATLTGANLSGTDLCGAKLERAVITRAILGTEPVYTDSGELITSGSYVRMTQQQLNQTYGDKGDPPKLNGAIDWTTCKELTLDNWPSGS